MLSHTDLGKRIRQQGNKATRQQGNKATRQQANKVTSLQQLLKRQMQSKCHISLILPDKESLASKKDKTMMNTNARAFVFLFMTTFLSSYSTLSMGETQKNDIPEPVPHREVHSGVGYMVPVPIFNEHNVPPHVAENQRTVATGVYGPSFTGSGFTGMSPGVMHKISATGFYPGFTAYSPVHSHFATVPGLHADGMINPQPDGEEYALHGNAYDFLEIYYIVPSDLEPYPGWQEKLSHVFLEVQEGFAYRMKKSNFVNAQNQGLTFGLLVNKRGLVKMKLIISQKTSKELGEVPMEKMNAVAKTIRNIADEYDSSHPQDKKGTTSIYILRNTEGKGSQLTDQPHGAFMGMYWDAMQHGYGYFVDSESAYKNYKGTLEQNKHWVFHTVMKSGLVHELGHAFGLEHHARASSDPMQVSIMSWANGVDFTSTNDDTLDFTLSSKEALALSQAFRQQNPKRETQLEVNSPILKCSSIEKDRINCKITYSSSNEDIALAQVYLNPKIDAWDYNSIAFYQKNIKPSEIDIEIPLSELQYKDSDSRMAIIPENGTQKWSARFVLIAKNGTRFSSPADLVQFNFVNGIPDFHEHDDL